MPENTRVSLNIFGLVQGVFFRAKTQKKAIELGLAGWVRNNNNGSVDCLAEGNKLAINKFINWCKKGPDSAKVSKINITWMPYSGEFNDFEIKY